MKQIYTALTKAEVHLAIHKAANVAGESFVFKAVADKMRMVKATEGQEAQDLALEFTSAVDKAIGSIAWSQFVSLKIGITLKELTRHPNAHVRGKAVAVLCRMRSAWAAQKSMKRKLE